MDKRRHQRIEVQNLIANLSNGVDSYSGTVSDVSRVGLLVTDIPQELNNQGEKLSIIISTKGKDFKMAVVPKWVSGNKSKNKMGLAILNAPSDWTGFIMNHEQTYEDIWAAATENIWAATTHLPDY